MSRNHIALSTISNSPIAIQLNLVWFKLSEFLNKNFSLALQGEMSLQLQFFFLPNFNKKRADRCQCFVFAFYDT